MVKTLFIFVWLFSHPVHVTVTSIDYIPEADSFKVFVRMYFDDFLLDCKLNGKDIYNSDFISDQKTSSWSKMEEYIEERIIIQVNEKQLSGEILDMQLADEEISMNLRYGSENNPNTITVKNLLMTDLYSDQVNMIIIRINDFEEGVKLTSEVTEQTFIIK